MQRYTVYCHDTKKQHLFIFEKLEPAVINRLIFCPMFNYWEFYTKKQPHSPDKAKKTFKFIIKNFQGLSVYL